MPMVPSGKTAGVNIAFAVTRSVNVSIPRLPAASVATRENVYMPGVVGIPASNVAPAVVKTASPVSRLKPGGNVEPTPRLKTYAGVAKGDPVALSVIVAVDPRLNVPRSFALVILIVLPVPDDTLKLRLRELVSPLVSVSRTDPVDDPEEIGVPLIVPFGLNARTGGKLDPVQSYVPVPPIPSSRWL